MAISIKTNVASIRSQRNLAKATNSLQSSVKSSHPVCVSTERGTMRLDLQSVHR